ncbi:hypothetical protein [Paraburkholderia sp.]|uniref:hypothetical protein n=1 Tax=Paraburkholderia sp. TaxID=1926495 RepID=UPI00260C834A|nr:hypothetical protein [Paraburkholderia sp.]
MQTIGYESEPSIVAAENIRGTLSDAHTDFLRAFVSEGTNGKSISDYRAAIELANDYLVAASQNIAYGDAERQPILRALDNLSLYQTLEGSALADGGNIYDIRAADDVIREHIIPAVDDLAAVNFAHLDNAYSGGRAAARIWLMAFCAASIALVLLLLYTQRYLLATFRRVINPWIAAGTVALALCAIAFGVCGTNFLSVSASPRKTRSTRCLLCHRRKRWPTTPTRRKVSTSLPATRTKRPNQQAISSVQRRRC